MPPEGKPLVYITGERALDFGPASVFGILRVMDVECMVPFAEALPPHMAFNDRLMHGLKKEMSSYVPDYDYICPVGAPAVMVAVGLILRDLGRTHRLLGWDNYTRRYMEYRIKL